MQPIWLWGRWPRRHLPLHLPPLQRPRLLHQVVLVGAHREQVEQHLEAPLVEVLEVPEALLGEALEVQRELEVLQAQVGLPPRVPREQSLEQCLPWVQRSLERA